MRIHGCSLMNKIKNRGGSSVKVFIIYLSHGILFYICRMLEGSRFTELYWLLHCFSTLKNHNGSSFWLRKVDLGCCDIFLTLWYKRRQFKVIEVVCCCSHTLDLSPSFCYCSLSCANTSVGLTKPQSQLGLLSHWKIYQSGKGRWSRSQLLSTKCHTGGCVPELSRGRKHGCGAERCNSGGCDDAGLDEVLL